MDNMKEKILTVAAAVVFYGIVVVDILVPDRYFSEKENRILQQKPEFSTEDFFSGEYAQESERYAADQFAGRDRFIQLKTGTQRLLGERLINGVYLGSDECLFLQHLSKNAGGDGTLEENAAQKLPELVADVAAYRENCAGGKIKVMLVPSSGSIWADKMPPYTASLQFGERAFLEKSRTLLEQEWPEDEVWVDVWGRLSAHREEPVYYKTDHHWTTLGAYYGYTAWAESMGLSPRSMDRFDRRRVSADFQGTLQSRLNIPWQADSIEIFEPVSMKTYCVTYDLGQKETDSLYEPGYLDTKNQYGFFLDDNHALIRIRTKEAEEPGRSILVIKDSYANCFVPFLTEHYGTVYVLDRRYYHGSVNAFLSENKIEDVLILYQIYGFLENG